MKMKSLLFLLALAVILQLAVPVAMIARREHVLRAGQPFKFRTAPVDPADAFRGRYVALSLDQRSVPVTADQLFSNGDRVFALLAEDADGFAHFTGLSRTQPVARPFLATRILYVSDTNAFLNLPFDRFYMEEGEAPAAETAYWQHSRRTNQTAYIQVRIQNGFGVTENLFINDTPIRDFLAQQRIAETSR